jgi:hypothetical protein
MKMRTVTLELLRHGPAHNQLLSPLTPYLALCGNHDAETIHVGFEHIQFTRYIEQLRYAQGGRMASSALLEAAREVSRVLESIRSLTAELASSDPEEVRRIVHLRLVLSASELALLPFELATAHSAIPGQGQTLSLQTVAPLCLTREVRRVSATTLLWPHQPRVLVISAAPLDVSAVPLREHLAHIKAALATYVDVEDEQQLGQHLTVIPEATLEKVREECAANDYTHVHILAHGMEREATGDETRYGLAFHAQEDSSKVDVVSGERLASALRCHLKNHDKRMLSRPAVVSIASCDSANLGTVVAPGASVAHALHEQGIPLVIGSQFPLTIKGSIIMAELLYRRLLAGDDPRVIVHDLRQALHVGCPQSHDWASVVVYAALPLDMEDQLRRARFEQARLALDVVMARADKVRKREENPPPGEQPQSPSREEVTRQLEQAMARFEAAAPQENPKGEQMAASGVLGRAWKRVAHFKAPNDVANEAVSPERQRRKAEFQTALEKARHYYYECYKMGSNEAWPLVQYLALTLGLGLEKEPSGELEKEPGGGAAQTVRVSKSFKRLWAAALARAEDNLDWGNLRQKSWAHASLAELALLSMEWKNQQKLCIKEATRHVEQVLEIMEMGQYAEAKFDAYTLLLQFDRYVHWNWGSQAMRELSQQLRDEMKRRGTPEHWTST